MSASTAAAHYRGRIAPSPTGLLHLGHARTFWIAYQRALAGTLILRNEDLDPRRSRANFAAAMIEDLHWLGIRWQEGPDGGGPFAPYVQSQRLEIYRAVWEILLARGYLYPCRCSRKDLAFAAQAPHEGTARPRTNDLDDEPVYPGTCRPPGIGGEAPQSSAPQSLKYAHSAGLRGEPRPDGQSWRFRVPDGEAIEFVDGHLGPQKFIAGRDFGDFLVWRRDGVPSYQLAVVADDAAMRVTEVVRGADLLKSTARQILLYRALGLDAPQWFHCDLVTDDSGQRLAKRHDALSLRALREQGRQPEELIAAFQSK